MKRSTFIFSFIVLTIYGQESECDLFENGTFTSYVDMPTKMEWKIIRKGNPGTYVRILEEGEVKKGDEVQLVEQSKNTLTVKQFYESMFAKNKSKKILSLFMNNTSVPQYKKERYKKFL